MKLRLSIMLTLMLGFGEQLVAKYSLPQYYQDFKAASELGEQLEAMIIAINDQPILVEAGSVLTYLRGDTIEVREAFLKDRSKKIAAVNIIGYINREKTNPMDDRGEVIDTSTNLVELEWAVDREQGQYAVLASSNKTLHGGVTLQPLEPELQYVDVTVNGEPRVVRAGDKLVMKSSDKFKIVAVASSVKDQKSVQFTIMPMSEVPDDLLSSTQGATYHSIIFSHRDYVFGTIPLVIH